MENKRVKSKIITGAFLIMNVIIIIIAASGYFYDKHLQELKQLKQLKDDQHYQNDVKG